MSKEKDQGSRYERIRKNTRNVHRYESDRSFTKEQFLEWLGSKPSIKIILDIIKNRKDAAQAILEALKGNPDTGAIVATEFKNYTIKKLITWKFLIRATVFLVILYLIFLFPKIITYVRYLYPNLYQIWLLLSQSST